MSNTNTSGKISGDPVATTLVGLDYAAIQAGGNVQVPQALLDAAYVTASELGTGVLAFLETPTSANLRAAITDETGTGALVFAGGNVGTATATSVNKVALTAPATGSTLTIADGKTLTVSRSLNFSGTDGTSQTFPATSATIARTDAAQTFTGNQSFTGDINVSKASPSFVMNKAASAQANTIFGETNGLERWRIYVGDPTAESGGNAGSDLAFLAFDDSGNFTFQVLSIVRSSGLVNLSKGQLAFPATQNPSTNPNVLDDYEEGTFTPTMAFGGASVGVTYGSCAGKYVKIGQFVFVNLIVTLTSKGSSTGNASVGGLPFTSNSGVGDEGFMGFTNAINVSTFTGAFGHVLDSSTSIFIRATGATGFSDLMNSNFSDTSVFVLVGGYRVAA